MTLVLTPTGAPLGTYVDLASPTRQSLSARAVNLESSAYDHVVRSIADLPTASGGYHTLTAGSWAFVASIDLGTNGLRILSGTSVFMTGLGWAQFLTSTATNVILVEGTLVIENMRVTSSTVGARILVGNSASAMIYATNVNLVVGTASTGCALIINADRFFAVGGRWQGTGGLGVGLNVNGNLTHVELIGVSGPSLGTFVTRTAGATGFASITGCWSDAPLGVNWAAANVPANGLIVNGNALLGATPFSGFTPASVRVNFKLNTSAANLLPETAIVP